MARRTVPISIAMLALCALAGIIAARAWLYPSIDAPLRRVIALEAALPREVNVDREEAEAMQLMVAARAAFDPGECLALAVRALRARHEAKIAFDTQYVDASHGEVRYTADTVIEIERCAMFAGHDALRTTAHDLDALAHSARTFGAPIERMVLSRLRGDLDAESDVPSKLDELLARRGRVQAALDTLGRDPARFRDLRDDCFPHCLDGATETEASAATPTLDAIATDIAIVRLLAVMLGVSAGAAETEALGRSIDPFTGAHVLAADREEHRVFYSTGPNRVDDGGDFERDIVVFGPRLPDPPSGTWARAVRGHVVRLVDSEMLEARTGTRLEHALVEHCVRGDDLWTMDGIHVWRIPPSGAPVSEPEQDTLDCDGSEAAFARLRELAEVAPNSTAADASHVYFTTTGRDHVVQRIARSGGTIETLTTPSRSPLGELALDATHVYWVDSLHGVFRAPKAGGEVEPIVTQGCDNYGGLAVSEGSLYFSCTARAPLPSEGGRAEHRVERIDLTTRARETVVDQLDPGRLTAFDGGLYIESTSSLGELLRWTP